MNGLKKFESYVQDPVFSAQEDIKTSTIPKTYQILCLNLVFLAIQRKNQEF